jgi:hypothetical protein
LDTRATEARLSLVLALLQGGYPDAALIELDRAAERAGTTKPRCNFPSGG